MAGFGIPSTRVILTSTLIAFLAIFLSNNVAFINNLTRSRG